MQQFRLQHSKFHPMRFRKTFRRKNPKKARRTGSKWPRNVRAFVRFSVRVCAYRRHTCGAHRQVGHRRPLAAPTELPPQIANRKSPQRIRAGAESRVPDPPPEPSSAVRPRRERRHAAPLVGRTLSPSTPAPSPATAGEVIARRLRSP